MIIVRLLRYILGYINFRAYGGFADRFINLCTSAGIPLWNIKNTDGRISASTTAAGYLAIRGPAKKSGMRVKALEKKGLKFFLRRNKKRVGILAGAVVFAVIIFILSQFIWSVSVVGNTTLEDDYLLSSFEKYGVKVGAKISSLDLKSAAQSAVKEIEKLSWATVNRKGTVLVIEVRERTEAPQMYDSSRPTNLVAAEDGVILSVDILYGNAEVKPGSAVVKGDLLISGIMNHGDGRESLIHADGHVKALTKKKNTFSSSDFSVFGQVSEKTRKSLFFFGIKIPLGTKPPETLFTEHKSFIENGEMLLPLGIITQYGAEYSSDPITFSESMQKKLALFSEAVYVKELLEYTEIRSSSMTEKDGEFGKEYEFYAECEQEIGTLQEIYVEKTDDIA